METYTISEFSRRTNISVYTLRYYEKEGIIKPIRNEVDQRQYREVDFIWIEFVLKLKATGMSIKNIKQYATLREIGDSTIKERLELLLVHQEQTRILYASIGENLEHLEKKIAFYQK